MSKIIIKTVFCYCLMILALPVQVDAQQNLTDEQTKIEIKTIKRIIKRQEICHDLLSRPCQNAEDYCFYPPCRSELSSCHNIEYDEFVLMATNPDGGVAKSRTWVQNQISEQNCITDHMLVVVDEDAQQVYITPEDPDMPADGSYYSVALLNSIVTLAPYADSIVFHEGRYPNDVSVVPFRLYYKDGFETDDIYFNLSDTEGGGGSAGRGGMKGRSKRCDCCR